MGLAETAELAIRISLTGNARTGIRGLKGDLGGLNTHIGRVGRGFGQIGTGLARAGLLVGGAAVAGIAGAAKAAIDFEDAFAGVRKTVDEAELTAVGKSFESLAQEFRDMATEIPIAATEFARLGEIAGALGVQADSIDDFVKTTALLGVTTDLSADQAAEALGKVGSILGLTGKDYEAFADILVNLGNAGASTESEILETAKRFAGVGRQAGLTNDEILALSSSITSLGAQPEAAGSALSRIFSNLSTEIANGTKKGKAFAKITGDSMDQLRKRIDKGDALGIVMETLEGISELSRTEAASVLKALGITNVRDRDAILKMAQNLDLVRGQLDTAADSAGALGQEATKRFATLASKIQILKNNAIEAAIIFGEGLTPAIGRAADKLTTFLRDPGNKAELKALGASVGETIDKIDWDKVLEGAKSFAGVMKGALDFVLLLIQAVDKLPAELKAAGLGFLALNKLSGGLVGAGVGNVVGGLAGAGAVGLAGKTPGLGKLFAQPVFVTNWPIGGMGGGGTTGVVGAGKGGIGALGKVFLVGEAIGLVMAVKEVADSVSAASLEQAQGIHETLNESLAGPNTAAQLKTKLDAIDTGIARLKADPVAAALITGPTIAELEKMRGQVLTAIGTGADRSVNAAERTKAGMVDATQRAADRSTRAAERTKGAMVAATNRTTGAVRNLDLTNNITINVPPATLQRQIIRYRTGVQLGGTSGGGSHGGSGGHQEY